MYASSKQNFEYFSRVFCLHLAHRILNIFCMRVANRILNISQSFLYSSSTQNFQYISTVLKCPGSHMSVKIFTLYSSDFWGPMWSKYLYKFFVVVQKWKYPTKVAAESKQGREKPQKDFVVKWKLRKKNYCQWLLVVKHRKNCECCPVSQLIVR